MKILILGGTKFLGRHIVEAGLAHNHQLTLFNRGETNPELFTQVEKLIGNRNGSIEALNNGKWDAVIDTSGYVPRIVATTAKLLAGAVNHYTFISSISVYAELKEPDIDESNAVGRLKELGIEVVNGETYGPLKALCEAEVESYFPRNALIIRPGLIVGPEDPTDRFTYWPNRVSKGGEILAPADQEYQVQFIDVRDLAEWTIRMVEEQQTGVFNATCPNFTLNLGQVLKVSGKVSGNSASFTWVDEKFLLEQNITPWSEIPLWIPENEEKYKNLVSMNKVSVRKAVAKGLTFRPLEETIRATLEWDRTRQPGYELKAGLKAEKEAEVLRAWHANTTKNLR